MGTKLDINDIYQKMVGLNLFNHLVISSDNTLKGAALIGDKAIDLKVDFGEHFPLVLPKYYLTDPNCVGFIPHVFPNGYICYLQREGIVIDYKNIRGILKETFGKAIKTIQDGLSGANKFDFVNEFNAYWNHIEGTSALSFINPDKSLRKIGVYKQEKYIILDEESSNRNLPVEEGVFIPLLQNTLITPPKYGTVWDAEYIVKNIFNSLSKHHKKELEKLTSQKSKKTYIFSLPQKDGVVLFGLEYTLSNDENQHLSTTNSSQYKIIPIKISRMDENFLIERGGGNPHLQHKRVAVIGCGSVGGYILEGLSKEGVQNLHIVDDDKLLPENIYRHILGLNYIFKTKVEALKEEISRKLIRINIATYPHKIEDILKKRLINFNELDLVIVATGNATINRYLNEYFIKFYKKTPIIFAWLEPYGIGGHAILVNNNSGSGCYNCLFDELLYNRTSFAEHNQYFTKSIAGCGSAFTPFGALDAISTANLTVRLAINTLLKLEKGNPLLSWKGESKNFIDAGYKLSPRYLNSSHRSLYEDRYNYKKPNCQFCKLS